MRNNEEKYEKIYENVRRNKKLKIYFSCIVIIIKVLPSTRKYKY